ncbi:hypothetical protein CR513_40861, partial [Mucuna pruriens]
MTSVSQSTSSQSNALFIDEDELDNDVTEEQGTKISETFDAASLISAAEEDFATGRKETESGKLNTAEVPLSARTATSCALAAISGVGYVPSHILDFLLGSRTSHTHLLPFLCRTPRYTG